MFTFSVLLRASFYCYSLNNPASHLTCTKGKRNFGFRLVTVENPPTLQLIIHFMDFLET